MGGRLTWSASSLSADQIAAAAGGETPSAGSPARAGIAAAMTARATGENFPVALRLLPARYRDHLMAVYGFARTVDDIGDEAPVAERARLLDELEADLGTLYAGIAGAASAAPGLGVIRALRPAASQCAIPQQPFLDLIQANRQDQIVSRYPRFADLLDYCRLSANPVGRIVLHVFGASSPLRVALSDQICTALQLAEHWQDVGEDFRAGRIYLPGEDMARFGCDEADLSAPRASARLRALIDFETRRARCMLDAGAPLVGTLRGFARLAVAGYVAGGRAALAAIAAANHDVLSATRRPGGCRTVAELLRCYLTGR